MKRAALFLLLIFLFSFVAGCAKEEVVETSDKFRIVTSFYPVYVATLNIIDGAKGVELTNFTDPDIGCMHDYRFTKNDIRNLTGVNLFIASGMGMESFVGKTSLGIPRLEVLDCGEDIEYILKNEDEIKNSHYWMNIENAKNQCEKIKRTLCRLNPENAAIYEANAAKYVDKLSQLFEEAKARAEAFEKSSVIAYHDSVEYFAEQFGINLITISEREAQDEEYMKDIKGVGKVLVQKSFLEDETFESFRQQTRCTPVIIDTLTDGELGASAKNAYFDAVRYNLDVLEQMIG